MLHIKLRYRDKISNMKWEEQELNCLTVMQALKMCGLSRDCQYQIISIERIEIKEPLYQLK